MQTSALFHTEMLSKFELFCVQRFPKLIATFRQSFNENGALPNWDSISSYANGYCFWVSSFFEKPHRRAFFSLRDGSSQVLTYGVTHTRMHTQTNTKLYHPVSSDCN